MKTLKKLSIIAVSFMLLFAACKKEEVINPGAASGETMKVRMTDGPANYAALDMEITGVDVYSNEKGWVTLSKGEKKINILALNNGVSADLTSDVAVSTGAYSKLKIHFGDNSSISVKNAATGATVTSNLTWTGPHEAEVTIDRKIEAGTKADIMLDFQVAQSVTEGINQYVIHPVIAELKDAMTGAKGSVKGTAAAAVTLANGSHHYDTYINASGEFLLRGVEPGTYEMIITPVQNMQVPPVASKHIEGVVITKSEINEMGTIALGAQ